MPMTKSPPLSPRPLYIPRGRNGKKHEITKEEKLKWLIETVEYYKNKIIPDVYNRKPLAFGKKEWEILLELKKVELSNYEYELLLITNPDIKKEIEEI